MGIWVLLSVPLRLRGTGKESAGTPNFYYHEWLSDDCGSYRTKRLLRRLHGVSIENNCYGF